MTEDTATIERDLAAVDAALASGAAAHEDTFTRELQELALELRADAPEPGPAFAEELAARVDDGFPRDPRSARGRAQAAAERQQAALERLAARAARGPDGLGRRLLKPIAGVGLPLLLIVVVVFVAGGPPSGSGGDSDSSSSAGGSSSAESGGSGAGSTESSGEDSAASAGGGAASRGDSAASGGGGAASRGDSAASGGGGAAGGGALQSGSARGTGDTGVAPPQPRPRDGGFVPGQRDRKIERSFSLELDVPLDDMARVADQVTAVTNRHGGFVLDSSVDTGEGGGRGDFSLRIPTERLRPALRDLAEVAPVIRQSQEGRDVTREHVTAKDRLQAARAERRSLLRRLEAAATDTEAEAIRRRLDLVAGEISGLRGQLRDLRLRTDYAVVTVSLLVAGKHDSNGVGGSFDDAMDDAGGLLVGSAGVLIRVLALALPLGLVALATWLAGRVVRRRRRESALA